MSSSAASTGLWSPSSMPHSLRLMVVVALVTLAASSYRQPSLAAALLNAFSAHNIVADENLPMHGRRVQHSCSKSTALTTMRAEPMALGEDNGAARRCVGCQNGRGVSRQLVEKRADAGTEQQTSSWVLHAAMALAQGQVPITRQHSKKRRRGRSRAAMPLPSMCGQADHARWGCGGVVVRVTRQTTGEAVHRALFAEGAIPQMPAVRCVFRSKVPRLALTPER